MNIWTVATLGIHEGRDVSPRTWGYYLTKDEAIAGMHRCVDTEAGYYTHVVIESFEPGIYAICHEENQTWFEWKDAWVACAKPETERRIVNYGMG
jgi:hypothetical protein